MLQKLVPVTVYVAKHADWLIVVDRDVAWGCLMAVI